MSETLPTPRALHLVLEGFPPERVAELTSLDAEIFHLTPENASAALEKIFAADTVAVWGRVG